MDGRTLPLPSHRGSSSTAEIFSLLKSSSCRCTGERLNVTERRVLEAEGGGFLLLSFCLKMHFPPPPPPPVFFCHQKPVFSLSLQFFIFFMLHDHHSGGKRYLGEKTSVELTAAAFFFFFGGCEMSFGWPSDGSVHGL